MGFEISQRSLFPLRRENLEQSYHSNRRRAFVVGLGSLWLTACVSGTSQTIESSAPKLIPHGGGLMDAAFAGDVARAIGGKGANILISPYSGEPNSTARRDTELLRGMGFRNLAVLDLAEPDTAFEQVRNARSMWFSGGAQKPQVLALSAVPGMRDALQSAYLRGCVMVGGSAGAAVMSRLMISGGEDGAAYTRQGLGFWPEVVLDQHVAQRKREYRLRKVIADNPKLVGVGLDESTWVIQQANTFTVRGRGTVHVVTVGASGEIEEKRLRSGARYDVSSRSLL